MYILYIYIYIRDLTLLFHCSGDSVCLPEWSVPSPCLHLFEPVLFPQAFRLIASAFDMLIITGIPFGAWILQKPSPPIFPSLDKKEAWTLYFLKMDLKRRAPIYLLGTFLSIKLLLLQTLTSWVLAFRSVRHMDLTRKSCGMCILENALASFLVMQ